MIDITGSGGDEDNQTYLKYYADYTGKAGRVMARGSDTRARRSTVRSRSIVA